MPSLTTIQSPEYLVAGNCLLDGVYVDDEMDRKQEQGRE